jgi:hypothetical protein
MRRARLALPAVVLLGSLGPGARMHAQDPRLAALDSIRSLDLDSISGVATAYYRPADRERALILRSMLEEYLAFWHPRLGLETHMRIAVLSPEDWQMLKDLPYGFPNADGPPANLILAAVAPPAPEGLDTILVEDGRNRATCARRWSGSPQYRNGSGNMPRHTS